MSRAYLSSAKLQVVPPVIAGVTEQSTMQDVTDAQITRPIQVAAVKEQGNARDTQSARAKKGGRVSETLR